MSTIRIGLGEIKTNAGFRKGEFQVENSFASFEAARLWNQTEIVRRNLLGVYVAPHRDGLGRQEKSSGKMIKKQEVGQKQEKKPHSKSR